MQNRTLVALSLVAAATPAVAHKPAPSVSDTSRAIAAVDGGKQHLQGRFAMQVAETGKVGGSVFLNSSNDYRAHDDLTFKLAPNVVKALTRRFGEAPDAYLKGRHVVVNGTLSRQVIVDKDYGRTVGFNRWQHVVPVLFAGQIVAVD